MPAALWSLKAIAGLSIAAIAALVARLARLRGVDPATAVAFVALNPLVLVHLVGGAHNDGLMVAVAMAAIAAALTSRPALAGAGFVAAAAIKVSAVLYAPFALVGSRERGRLVAGALAALALFAAVSLLAFGPHVSEAFSVAGGNQDRISRWSVPATLARITGADVDLFRVLAGVAYAAAVAALLVASSRGLDWVRAAGLGELRPAGRVRLHGPLVPDLAAAAGGDLPRPGADRCDDPADLVPGDQRSADMSDRKRYERSRRAADAQLARVRADRRDPGAARGDGRSGAGPAPGSGSATTRP